MTLTQWYQHLTLAFQQAGFDHPSQEAKWLITSALDKEASFLLLHPHYQPSSEEGERLEIWKNRRLGGEPLSRLKGTREFWSLPFHLNAHTLDPRPESETLIEGALEWFKNKGEDPLRILDLGTGTGCLLISLLTEYPLATGIGVDKQEKALEMACFNAKLIGVGPRAHFIPGEWGKGLQGPFDLIVSNPPYIPLKDKEALSQNVTAFDPALALFGGEDGLEAYRTLPHDIQRLLAPKGLAILEIGYGQRREVEALFYEVGFKTAFVRKDLAGIERALGFLQRT